MSGGFVEFLEELFEPVSGIHFRRMFGGTGIFRDGVMIALEAYDTLYLKTDDAFAEAFQAEGKGPFVYEGKGKPISMSYHEVPERLFDEREEFIDWVDRATEVAKAAAAKKKR